MSQTSAETLRVNLVQLLKAHDISEAELARRARVPQTTVNRIFRSREVSGTPRLDTLDRLARGLKTSVVQLLTPLGAESITPNEDSPQVIARQLGRLTEDFLLSSKAGRREILRVATDWAARLEEKI